MFRMGHEALFVLFGILGTSALAPIDFATAPHTDKPRDASKLAIDFTRELPAKQSVENTSAFGVHLQFRDNSADGDWARQIDYDLIATHGRLSVACNAPVIVRNIDEAQVVASVSIEY
jgi:hypothetical protein